MRRIDAGMACGSDLDIFHDIISGDQAGSMFETMEPPFLGTRKETDPIFYLSSRKGRKG